ncbi:MAG: flavodoxin family protein [archaeon]
MKVIGINGSPRLANTEYMVKTVLEATGRDYELINLKDMKISPCKDCRKCHNTFECATKDDMQKIYPKLKSADVIILGSPTYFDNVSGIMKNFIDRCLPLYFSKELKAKKTGLVTSANFKEYLEFNEEGKCKWHKEETESALNCLSALENFSEIIGLNVIGKVYALHSDPLSKKEDLISLGKMLSLKNKI